MIPIPVDGPAVEPVSAAEMRDYLRLDDAGQDDLVAALVAAARIAIEAATRLALIQQTWRLRLKSWPGERAIALPLWPLIGVVAVRVYGASGTTEIVAPELLRLDADRDPARLLVDISAPEPGRSWQGIEIDLLAGFGATPAAVPAPLRQAIRMLVAHWFENRGDGSGPGSVGLPGDVAALIAGHRRARLA